MGEEHEVFIESSVGGYHAYFVNASVAIGEVLTFKETMTMCMTSML